MGIEPGDKVSLIGSGQDDSDWARLDRAKIVAEVTQTSETGDSIIAFWNSSPEVQLKVIDALKSTGAKAVVAAIPPRALTPGWIPVGDTGHAIYFLQ
jgi:hypothetical protein